ncbi:MAG: hypothetical protein ABI277_04415 [Burkholderiaceae bacterium]
MYFNLAVLAATRPHERRVALVPAVVPNLVKLGTGLHNRPARMKAGAVIVELSAESGVNRKRTGR